jgi:ADP-ribosylglycohydrolase
MNADERLSLALLSLEGLSVGDAFGECFFGDVEKISRRIAARGFSPPPWRWTDDTAMACSVVRALRRSTRIVQTTLADDFAAEYASNPRRGYGGMAHTILRAMGTGVPRERAAREAFDGLGSFGNGGAMRVAPIGAYFSDDPALAAEQARLSSEITHAHPEGQAGAIAVALAAAWAASAQGREGTAMLDLAIELTPDSEVRSGIQKARQMGFDRDPQAVAAILGNGSRVSAQDTVPFTLWCAARHVGDYAEALWTTVRGLGDMDTTCAIVGGIVALSAGRESIPAKWRASREPLPMDFTE